MKSNLNQDSSNGKRRIRYAVVGLGYFAQQSVLPAFAHAKNSELVALVSDDPVKREELGQRYEIRQTYAYKDYEDCLAGKMIDAVYIALPNNLHREYSVRAARAGVHVLCEKPMAIAEQECEDMIAAAAEHNVKLMIAYRLHFEQANLKAIEIVQSGKLGEPRLFNSVFTMQVQEGNVRLQKALGGGPLYDIGIYCINAARYLFQEEPLEVFAYNANNGEERFREVDEMISAVLRFPQDRLAAFTCSFGASDVSSYQVIGTKGNLRVEPAYESSGSLKHHLTVEGKTRKRTFPDRGQVAAELVYFSDCILRNKEPEPSGMEGLADVRIIRALHHSIETGKTVKLGHIERDQKPTPAQEIWRPPVEKTELVHAESPSGSD